MLMLLLVLSAQSSDAEVMTSRLGILKEHFQYMQLIETVPAVSIERESRLAAIGDRLDVGVSTGDEVNALYRDMDAVREWLWGHAVARPERVPGVFEETPEEWTVTTLRMTLSVTRSDLSMVVVTPETRWDFMPCDDADLQYDGQSFSLRSALLQEATAFHTGYSAGMRMVFGDFEQAPGFTLYLTVYLIGDEVVFDLAADETDPKLEMVHWPKSLVLPASEDTLTLCTTMQGTLLPGNWHQGIEYENYTNSREFTMPWWGHVVDGHGALVVLETPDDAGGRCIHAEGGSTQMAAKWYPSLGKLRYLRSIRYIFEPEATYVSLTKRYRQYVKEKGRFVSLEEKCIRTPVLRTLIGSSFVHIGSMVHYVPEASMYNKEWEEVNHFIIPFERLEQGLRRLKGQGIERAFVHVDGWGYYGYDSAHPDIFPPGYEQGGWDGMRQFGETCQELGYFFTIHDQYRDFYFNAVSFDDRLAATDIRGERFEISQWAGGKQTVLSARYAPEYVRRNYDLFRSHQIGVEGTYLDVFSIWPYDESFQPGCPVTRTECAQYRQESFDLLRARGMVVTSEEASDRYAGCLDMVKHCPYPKHPYIWAGDEAFGIPTPLFSLVYHDSVIIPWNLNAGGWGIPPGTTGYTHCLLHAGVPWAFMPYEESDIDPEHIAKVIEASALAKSCAFAEMVDHAFLNVEKTRQRTTFSNGVQVTVDFVTEEHCIESVE